MSIMAPLESEVVPPESQMQGEAMTDEMKAQLAEAREWEDQRKAVTDAALRVSLASQSESVPQAPAAAPSGPPKDSEVMEDVNVVDPSDVLVPDTQPMIESQPQL